MRKMKEKINLAIVIPTLNEEHYIGKLLDSITIQTVMPEEIVIVDAYSKDKTISEIKKRQKQLSNLRYFKIPKSTISRQRNYGAKKTKACHLLFLDADMQLPYQNTLEKYFKEVLKNKPEIAAAENWPDSKIWKDLIYFKVENLSIKFIRYIWPVVTGRNLYIKRTMFNKVEGFDERISVGEDQDLVQRIIEAKGKLIFLKTVKLYTSNRRVEQEGRRKYAIKMVLYGLSVLLFGRHRTKIDYEFGKFTNLNK